MFNVAGMFEKVSTNLISKFKVVARLTARTTNETSMSGTFLKWSK